MDRLRLPHLQSGRSPSLMPGQSPQQASIAGSKDHLSALPFELATHILSFVDAADIISVRDTSHWWRSVAKDQPRFAAAHIIKRLQHRATALPTPMERASLRGATFMNDASSVAIAGPTSLHFYSLTTPLSQLWPDPTESAPPNPSASLSLDVFTVQDAHNAHRHRSGTSPLQKIVWDAYHNDALSLVPMASRTEHRYGKVIGASRMVTPLFVGQDRYVVVVSPHGEEIHMHATDPDITEFFRIAIPRYAPLPVQNARDTSQDLADDILRCLLQSASLSHDETTLSVVTKDDVLHVYRRDPKAADSDFVPVRRAYPVDQAHFAVQQNQLVVQSKALFNMRLVEKYRASMPQGIIPELLTLQGLHVYRPSADTFTPFARNAQKPAACIVAASPDARLLVVRTDVYSFFDLDTFAMGDALKGGFRVGFFRDDFQFAPNAKRLFVATVDAPSFVIDITPQGPQKRTLSERKPSSCTQRGAVNLFGTSRCIAAVSYAGDMAILRSDDGYSLHGVSAKLSRKQSFSSREV